MKKHLIAAAVAAATVAAPAMAQNVTIGGNFDVSYDLGKQNSDTQAINTAGAFTTSALTIGGTEDLGGGLAAYFNVNSRLGGGNQINGSVGSVQALQDANAQRAGAINFGDRGFQVGIRGAFGDIAIGKTTGTAIGGVIRGGVVGNFSLLSESLWGDRPNNMISYSTPKVSGFTGRVVYQLSGGTANSNASNGSYELSGQYAQGPLTVDIAWNSVKAGAYGNTTAALNTNQGTATTVDGNDTGARIQYNLGVAAVNVSVLSNETAAAAKRSQYSFGVTVPMGAWSFLGEYGSRDAAASTTGDTFYNIGAVYNLSKRTNIYGVYAVLDDTSNAAGRGLIGGGANSADGVAGDGKMVVGLRHSF
jgi:predicted porin